VAEAANGDEAVRAAGQHTGTLHLLVTDVVLPQLSGPQLAERLVKERKALRVLYLSGYTANSIPQRDMLSPGFHLLEKPFSPEALARKVREVLEQDIQALRRSPA
jgi:two-component system cell cycle sensor histidine kinase/response regulator CckA